jgi:UPF0042 nucleotide-binding protein
MKQKFVIVSGMAGAGIGTAIKFLDSVGFYTTSNVPTLFLRESINFFSTHSDYDGRDVAIGMLFETQEQVVFFLEQLSELKKEKNIIVVGLSASNAALVSRFNYTRRRHPWKNAIGINIDLLQEERSALKSFFDAADFLIDTSGLSERELEKWLSSSILGNDFRRRMVVSLVSFGFKHGAYYPLDLLYDVRFLKNPYFVPALREQSGLDVGVQEFFQNDPEMTWYLSYLNSFHKELIPKYGREGKNYLRIGVGCTGGQHRSVYVVERMVEFLRQCDFEMLLLDCDAQHRDMEIKHG